MKRRFKMKKQIYSYKVEVHEPLKTDLKKVLKNHLVLYNHALMLLKENPHMEMKELTKRILKEIESNNIKPYIRHCLSIELFYLYLKFQRNNKSQKLISDIQYLTFLFDRENENKDFIIDRENGIIHLRHLEGDIYLNEKIPEFDKDKLTYCNLSYSNISDEFLLTIFTVDKDKEKDTLIKDEMST